jgi:maltose/moltooligosaccharide transporter
MEKRKLGFWEIWNMSFGFLGIQFGFALQNANTSRIFDTLGADVDKIGLYWLAAPLTGLIIQPIVGYFSDRTWTRLGRRRPYFLAGAILSATSFIHHAELSYFMDRDRHVVDHGFIHQHFDGTVSRFCWRQPS